VQSLSLKFFTSVKTGEVMSRLNHDVSGVSRVVGDTIVDNGSYKLIARVQMEEWPRVTAAK